MFWFKVSGKAGYWQVEIQDRVGLGGGGNPGRVTDVSTNGIVDGRLHKR